jgi:hypothetical protein
MSAVPPSRPGRPTPGHGPELFSTPSLLALAVVAFVVELALFGGVGAIAHHASGGGLRGWVAAAAATVAVLVLWALFMAPKGKFRLGPGARVVVAAILVLATAYGLVDAGWSAWGWFVGIAGVAVVAAQLVLPTSDQNRT